MEQIFQDRRGSTSDRLKPGPNLTRPVTIHYEIQNHTTRMQKITKAFQVYRLMVLTLVCVIAGVIIGLICRRRAHYWTERQFMYIEFPGELYLRFLRLIIIPLLVSNVILSFGTIQGKISSQLGKVAGFIYLGNNFMAIMVAILIVIIICPGGRLVNSNNNDNHQHQQLNERDGSDGQIVPRDGLNLADHHYFNEYHESISKYREYHPMYYHSNKDPPKTVASIRGHQVDLTRYKRFIADNDVDKTSVRDQESAPINQQTQHTTSDPIFRREVQSDEEADLTTQKQVNQDREISIEASTQGNRSIILNNYGEQTANLKTGQKINANENSNQKQRYQRHTKVGFNGLQNMANTGNNYHYKNNLYKTDGYIHDLNTKLAIDVVLDALRNLIPDSLIGSTLQQTRTRLFAPIETLVDKNGTMDPAPSLWPMGHEMINQPNIIGLLAASVLAGVVLSHMEEASRPVLDLCSCVSELSLRVGMKAINLAPPCIMFLLIGQVARARDLSSMASELLMYCMTVIIALLLHGFVLLPLIYYFITKKSPVRFFNGMIEALVASFATSSSSATMPLMLNCLADLDLNLVIVRAFGPLGCVFNMNGTAIFEAVGVIFIAQTLSVPLPFTSILLIGFCSAVASLSTAGIPSSGMMNMVIVLNSINLPVLQLSLIYIVDFIIDRFRTVINVWSGAIVCGLVDHICPEHLFEEEMKPEKYREMMKYRGSRGSLNNRKSIVVEEKPQVISVTITPPVENSNTATAITTSV